MDEEKMVSEYIDALRHVAEHVPLRVRLLQLAEEATELAQAALKLERVIEGINPTPLNKDIARSNLEEEAADVRVCLDACGILDTDEKFVLLLGKMQRWKRRLLDAEMSTPSQQRRLDIQLNEREEEQNAD